MIVNRKNLIKTEQSDLFLYNSNCSEVISMSSGMARFQMYLPYDINNGVYYLCSESKYFSDYLIFAVNQKDHYIDCPGIYTSFSPYGINFTIWTQFGRFCIFDTVTDITAGESFLLEFCWDHSGSKLGKGATMALYVNGVCTASANHIIDAADLSGVNMYVFDSKYIDFNMRAGIQDVMFFSELGPDKFDTVSKITNTRFSTDELFLCGKSSSVLYTDWFGGSNTRFDDLSCFSSTQYGVAMDDITGDVYFSSYNDTTASGKVAKFDVSQSKITATLHSMIEPRAICVIQKDRMDFPRYAYYDQSECDGLLIASGDSVIRTDSSLVKQAQSDTFNSPFCVKYWPDRTVWVSDTGNNLVKRMSEDLSTLLFSIAIQSPTFLATTVKNDVYVYSSTLKTIYLIKDGIIKASVLFSDSIAGFDVDNNSRRVVVAFSDGTVKVFGSKLQFIRQARPSTSISAIHVRRGYQQDCYVIVNEIDSKIVCARVSVPYIIVSESFFDPEIYFNGSVCCTAKNVGVEVEAQGEFDIRYGLDVASVKDMSAVSYKVIRRDVDLSNGGEQGAYFDLMNITSDVNPTDPKGKIVKSFEADK